MSHLGDHLPQAHILRHTAAEKDLVLADVGHRAFRHLGEHGERRFLNGKRYVLQRHPFALECQSRRHEARERHVHALDGIRQPVEFLTVLGELLEDGSGIETHTQIPSELIQHIAYPYVLGLAEDPVPVIGEGYDLGIASGGIQQRWIVASALGSPDLYVGYAVVDAHDRDVFRAREGPRRRARDPEARTQARTHGEGNEIDITRTEAGGFEGSADNVGYHIGMVIGSLPRMQAAFLRPEHIDLIGENFAIVVHDARSERMRRPLDAECDHDAP